MAIVVQKFGGTSVADASRLREVARRIIATRARGDAPVVVVSAQGDTTDRLLAQAREVNPQAAGRELDMLLATGEQASMALLALAIQAQGAAAISLTGAQVGIRTDGRYGTARILGVDAARIRQALAEQQIVIVAGFQGISDSQEITTLGRGGSDTTAVALAAALEAKTCEIYTDVDGVFTADPRLVPEARLRPQIGYDEMLELASQGARVLHLRCVEIAKNFGVVLHVRSSFHERPGTLVKERAPMEEAPVITGIAHDTEIAKLTLLGVPDRPGVAARLFQSLAENGVNVDIIAQSASRGGWNDISFTVARESLPAAIQAAEAVCREIGAERVETRPHVAKVSVVGAGMLTHPGVASQLFRVIAEQGVNVQLISTSDISITCVIDPAEVPRVVRAVHEAFLSG